MRRFLAAASSLVFAELYEGTVVLAQEKPPANVQLEPRELFDGTLTTRTKAGESKDLHVVTRNWSMAGGQKIQRFPEEGLMIVQLRAGTVITEIDGKRQERHEGEFWTVPAGSAMAIETGNDTAVFQTVVVKNRE